MTAVGVRQPWKAVVRPSIDWAILFFLIPSLVLVPLILVLQGFSVFELPSFRALAVSAVIAAWMTLVLLRQGRLLSLACSSRRGAPIFTDDELARLREVDPCQPLFALQHEQGGILPRLLGNRFFSVTTMSRPSTKRYVDAHGLLAMVADHGSMGGLSRWSADSTVDQFLKHGRLEGLRSRQTERSIAIYAFGEANAARLLIAALVVLAGVILWGAINESPGVIAMELESHALPSGNPRILATLSWAAAIGPILAPFVILIRSYLPGQAILVGRCEGADCLVPPLLHHSTAPEGTILLTSKWGELLVPCRVGELRHADITTGASGTPVLRLEMPNGEIVEVDWSSESETLLNIVLGVISSGCDATPRRELP